MLLDLKLRSAILNNKIITNSRTRSVSYKYRKVLEEYLSTKVILFSLEQPNNYIWPLLKNSL